MGKAINGNGFTSSTGNGSRFGIQCIQHIPTLPNSNYAFELLQRLFKEFQPLTQSRGYSIVSVTEMCCCGDGEHHISHPTKNKKKFRKMSNSVAGFNRSVGSRGHEIHLRLRKLSPLHELLSYEEVAGVFIHELAHCEIGPHSVEFYQLMEVIEEQFHTNMVNGVVAATNTVKALNGALFTGVGHILGSRNYNTINANGGSSSKDHREAMARAAERRHQLSQITRIGGAVLGGRKPPSKLSPREAAASAAERRLKDSQWCVLCTDIVELTDDKSDRAIHYEKIAVLPTQQQSSTTSSHPTIVKPTPTECYYDEERPKIETSRSTGFQRYEGTSNLGSFIDLVESDDESNIAKQSKQEISKRNNDDTARLGNAKRAASIVEIADFTGQNIDNMRSIDSKLLIDLTGDAVFSHSTKNSEEVFSQLWACKKCTFFNTKNNLSCEVCGSPVVSEGKGQKLARIIQREEEMKQLTIMEQNRSKEQFGGFNIYQGGRKNTITMKHMT
jgi:RNA polymerase subunit RPABC4/transcription elongation factor Spt4